MVAEEIHTINPGSCNNVTTINNEMWCFIKVKTVTNLSKKVVCQWQS